MHIAVDTAAVSDGSIFIRTDTHLHRISVK
jgi:hypothetical protein